MKPQTPSSLVIQVLIVRLLQCSGSKGADKTRLAICLFFSYKIYKNVEVECSKTEMKILHVIPEGNSKNCFFNGRAITALPLPS